MGVEAGQLLLVAGAQRWLVGGWHTQAVAVAATPVWALEAAHCIDCMRVCNSYMPLLPHARCGRGSSLVCLPAWHNRLPNSTQQLKHLAATPLNKVFCL